MKIEELEIGEGREAARDDTVRVRYDGFLSHGDRFQSAIEQEIDLGAREVIAGLRYGIAGMRPGGKRRIRVPPHLAYGRRGVPGVVPANAVLIFEVELLQIFSQERPA